MERFMGILIEHYGGAFPVWLAPVQVKILTISRKYTQYAREIYSRMQDAGIRVELDERAEKIGLKVREAEMEKVPYILVIGEKEEKSSTISVRRRFKGDEGRKDSAEFLQELKSEIENKGGDV